MAPVRDLISAGGVDAAYAVQEVNTRHYVDSGRRLVGRKIGLTSLAVQRQLGVDQPDYGMLFADMDVPEGIPVSLDQVIQPKVEAEIAIVIGRDLPHPDLTTAEMIRAVEYVVPAIEIVDSRVANWDIRIWDTVADNASSGLFVLGAVPRKLDGLDLRECGMVMEIKGEPISVGAGIACLGSPITASLWLARVMARVGRPLLEGDVILSGALGPMAGVKRGDVVEARINGVGTVRAEFAADGN
ncbi:2-keto-4-pentenoate hydratase [Sphingopyxis bauzanensis]|nr:2-keto-4-pentenoate hydratase [Sphingopyxis bauzanensis]